VNRHAILLDLDGTLVDTAPDMAAALGVLLAEEDHTPLPFAAVRPYVSKGAAGLVTVGFGDTLAAEEHERLRHRYLQVYAEHLCVASAVFPELAPVLARIEATANTVWGIVTNKPTWLAEPLLEALQLHQRAACLVCGDTLPRRKPHPDPLFHAAKLIDVAPARCIYVGDDRRDITAGRAAGMVTVAAGWGYIPPDDPIEQWGADMLCVSPAAMDEWLTTNAWLHADNP
jgi:2-phosphoglycolate phosphatase